MQDLVAGVPVVNHDVSYLRACVGALLRGTNVPTRIYVVDNRDEPLERDDAWPRHLVRIVRPERNLGCAGSWNLILALAGGSPTAIVNDDLEVAPNTLEHLAWYPKGAVVCAHGFSCFRIDRDVVDRVGLFDTGYFPVYWEDADYRYRCRLAGVDVIEWSRGPTAIVDERDVASHTGIVHGKPASVPYQGWEGERQAEFRSALERNRLRYVAKWGGEPGGERFATPFGEGRSDDDRVGR